MRSFLRCFTFALAALAISAIPAWAGCTGVTGTADGFNKTDAVAGAQAAVRDAAAEVKAQKKVSAVSVSARRPKPRPYWRSEVSADLYLKPDVVTAQSHTICWSGVVSPVVCSSGAKVCW